MKQYDKETIEKAKKWFARGELNVDLIIEKGYIKLETILKIYEDYLSNQ